MKISTPTFKTWIILALAIVIIYLVTCNKKTQEVLSSIPTPTQQLKPIIINEGLSKLAEDSIIELAYASQQDAKNWEEKYYQSMQDYVELANNSDSVVNTLVPDTCKEFQASVKKQFQQLAANNKKTQDAHNRILSAKNNDLLQKEALLANCKKDYSYLRKAFDTSLIYQGKLSKSNRPMRSVGGGIMTEAAWVQPYKFDAGVFIYYRGKNGNQFSVGALTSQRIVLSYSKDIFKIK